MKNLRQQVNQSLIHLLRAVVEHQPGIIIGDQQGGVIAGMSTFPVILEQICRHTPTPQDEMERFRRAWAAVEGVIIIDPAIYPQKRWEVPTL